MNKTLKILYLIPCWALACAPDFPQDAPSSDAAVPPISLNELLFDPPSGGCDYVELVNTGDRAFELSLCRIGNRNKKGEVASLKSLPAEAGLLPPGGYALLCSDTLFVKEAYAADLLGCRVVCLPSLPSFPQDSGCVVLCDAEGNILDEMDYSASWHHPLMTHTKGVALEKIHPCLPSGQAASWLSASADSRYGTPGRGNSQYRSPDTEPGWVGFRPEESWLRPASEGRYAQLAVFYSFPDVRVATVQVFDRTGISCATLASCALLGSLGCLVWKGVSDEGEPLPPGSYLLRCETLVREGHREVSCFPIGLYP